MTVTTAAPKTAAEPTLPKTAFTAFWLFEAKSTGLKPDAEAIASAVSCIEHNQFGVEIRAAYSTAGLCPGVDLILWLVSEHADSVNDLAVSFLATEVGFSLKLKFVYFGVASMSQYDPDHGPAFLKGLEPRTYLSVYPFTKTPEWFLLPYEQRRDLMIEHGRMGKEFPSVLTNTVNSFGIADQEFIVALEDDDPAVLVKMVQRLRGAEVRKYTAVDTPIFLGRKRPFADILTAIVR